MSDKAVFLDRDGTIIEDPGYLADPSRVKLLPGVELAIKSLRQAGYKIVVVTNQSGVARGLFSEDDLESIHAEMRRQFAEKGAMLDAIYYCPYHPAGTVMQYARESDLRKPSAGMLLKAAAEMDIDLAGSWMVGDSARDVGAGQRGGCRTIRILTPAHDVIRPAAMRKEEDEFHADFDVRNLVDAARMIMREAARDAGGVEEADDVTPPVRRTFTLPKVPFLSKPAADPAADDPPALPVNTYQPAENDSPTASDETTQPSVDSSPEGSSPEDSDMPDGVFGGNDSEVRRQILQHVRQMSKQAEHEEFNLASMVGGVAQVLTGLFLLLTFWKAIGYGETAQATLWAIVAVVFQAMSLTFFTMAKKQK
ncbi:MAG: HAD family hydrolase [Phycisphaerae bacterium]|nr:HAD family hydrolase [Phycisphaerae bacterium]